MKALRHIAWPLAVTLGSVGLLVGKPLVIHVLGVAEPAPNGLHVLRLLLGTSAYFSAAWLATRLAGLALSGGGRGGRRRSPKLLQDLLISRGEKSPYELMIKRWEENEGDIMDRVTTRVECAEYFPQRAAALTAHATQIDPAGAFLASPVEDQRSVWPTEEFELAKSRVETQLPETDLFAGVK